MAIVVPDTSDQLILGLILNQITADGSPPTISGDRKLKLFQNNLNPSKSTLLGDITEVTASGYSEISINGANWVISNISGVNIAEYPTQTFNITSNVGVYGYYVTDYTGTDLLWVERFSTAPFELPGGGGTITVTLKLTLN